MSEAPARRVIRTTCPRDCYDGCGMVVELENERISRVLGDPDHPVTRGALCGKCALAYNGVWIDPQARLSSPLKRVGPKGAGKFEPISWKQALDEVATRLHAAIDESGPASILHAHYTGTCSLLAGDFPMRFFNRIGATELDPDSICNKAGHVALGYVYGTSTHGFDPRTVRDSRCIMLWGVNPSATGPHAHKRWLAENDCPLIVVDPVRHETAERATLHLQPRPGTDAALAFAMMQVISRDGLCARDFLSRHTVGWNELEASLSPCTADWAEQVTGVPAGLIEQAARLYAAGPSLLWLGQGLQRQRRGGNVMRACAALPAVTGNLGRPGAGIYYLNGSGPRGIDSDYVCAPHLARESSAPASLSHMDLVTSLADAEHTRAFICWNMNVAASAPRQASLRKALRREDLFTIVIDPFLTDTAEYADLVLPAASFLEFDDLVIPYFHMHVSA